MTRKNPIFLTYLGGVILVIAMTVAGCGKSHPKDRTAPPASESGVVPPPTTTTTTPWTDVHTINSRNNMSEPAYVWHGTMDGVECLETSWNGQLTLSCDWESKANK